MIEKLLTKKKNLTAYLFEDIDEYKQWILSKILNGEDLEEIVEKFSREELSGYIHVSTKKILSKKKLTDLLYQWEWGYCVLTYDTMEKLKKINEEKMKSMTDFQCNKCKIVKPLDCFSPNKTSKYGYMTICKECNNKRMREYNKQKKRKKLKKNLKNNFLGKNF